MVGNVDSYHGFRHLIDEKSNCMTVIVISLSWLFYGRDTATAWLEIVFGMFFISLLILTLAKIVASVPANLRNRMHINDQVELGLDRAWDHSISNMQYRCSADRRPMRQRGL